MSVALRPARPEDAVTIGRVHVEAWRQSYGGIVPEERLAALDAAERAGVWAAIHRRGPARHGGEDAEGIAGFSLCGEQREPELGCDGEFWAIYCCDARRAAGSGGR